MIRNSVYSVCLRILLYVSQDFLLYPIEKPGTISYTNQSQRMKKFSTRVPGAFLFFICLVFQFKLDAQLPQTAVQQIQSLLQEKASRTPVQQKIDSRLLQAVRESRGERMAANVALEPADVKADRSGTLKVDIDASISEELISRLASLGGSIIFASPEYHTVRAVIGLKQVETIAAYPEVKFIEPAAEAITIKSGSGKTNSGSTAAASSVAKKKGYAAEKSTFAKRSQRVVNGLTTYLATRNNGYFGPFTGTVNAQGDRTHRADDVRNTYGYAGQGIRIGVLSDSYNSLGTAAGDITGGNLPGVGNPWGNTTPVTVLEDITDGSDEGRAMLQIVHDLAPKAQLFFATAYNSVAAFATNIQKLRAAPYNCDIIIDDIGYSDEAVFQDDILSQAVNKVTASGAWYFSSAGNEGSTVKNTASVWEGDFTDVGSTPFAGSLKQGTVHNFGTLASPVNGDIILTNGGFVYSLSWSDPLGASANDYDLFLVSSTGTIKAASTNVQNGLQDPIESFDAPALSSGDRLVVFKSAAAQVRAIHLNSWGGRLTIATPGQIHGHAAAADAFAVAATQAAALRSSSPTGPFPNAFNAGNRVEPFTSQGPRRMFYNADGTPITPGNILFATNGGTVRAKPDITAADGVSTTLPSASGLNPFFGTSAAAPHAGAIAALLKSAKPSLTLAELRNLLTTTALDIETAGFDNVSGNGIVQAYQAMQALNPAPMPAVALGTVSASEATFSNGNGVLEPGEIGNLVVQLTNPSLADATGVTAAITTVTTGVTIVQGTAAYGSIAASGNASNSGSPFVIGLSNILPCGLTINFLITVSYSGGSSPQTFPFAVTLGSQGSTISSTLGATPPANPAYTFQTGLQKGRINRAVSPVTCGIVRTTTLGDTLSGRAFDAYTFTNKGAGSACVTVTLSGASTANLYTSAYNENGYQPAAPNVNFIGEPGTSNTAQNFSVLIAAGKQYTIVVSAVNVGAATGTAYTLSTSYTQCTAGPACNPIVIVPAGIATGATGTAYTQAFSATGGSGSGFFTFAITGNLPAGLSFTGNTLSGTPTQAGSFPVTVTATDPVGCSVAQNYTLTIAGTPPASVTATAGTPQTVYLNTAFSQLQATVRDAAGNPLPGVNVTFTAPAAGATGTFPGALRSVTVVTNANGLAAAPVFTSNGVNGSYTVTASVNGIPPASFALTNFCPSAFVVTSSADSGPGSLRDIIANGCPGITVTFDPSVRTILLTSGDLVISKSISINGPGADKLTISGSNSSRIFRVTAGNAVTISGITIRDGKVPASSVNGGGGILLTGGNLNVSQCVLTNNDASQAQNAEGGGIDNEGGTVAIYQTSIVNNTAADDGGGVAHFSGTMSIVNSTIANNTAGDAGSGGGVYSYFPLTVTNSTIYGNTANYGGNISHVTSTVTLRSSIIGGGGLLGSGGAGPDLYGSDYTSANFNLIENITGVTNITGATTFNIIGVKANLLPLGYYSGVLPVLLPRSNSRAINAGDSTITAGLDQRSQARVIGRRMDIGAVEANYIVGTSSGTPQTSPVSSLFPLPMQALIVESGIPVAGDSLFFQAPVTGASGTFPGGLLSAGVATNAAGLATSPVFTANTVAGRYNVTGSIGAEYPVISFDLTNTAGGALPVQFGGITAKAVNCQVQLQWKTYFEQNARDFTVEYSRDGVVYETVGTVAAKGTGNTTQNYAYTHGAPANGTVYYRIRQTDVNGAYTVGDVITVTNSCSSNAVIAYPNPVKDKLIIQIGGSGQRILTVYDVIGRQMTKMNVSGGRYELNTKNWAQGLYTLTVIQHGTLQYTLKVIKD